jgi:hypothetical protein
METKGEVMTYEQMTEGLAIFSKYLPEGKKGFIEADHDVIWAEGYEVTGQEDLDRLEELGWHWSDEYDTWTHYC